MEKLSKAIYTLRVVETKNGGLDFTTESNFGGNIVKAQTVAYKLSSDMREILKWILEQNGEFTDL